MHYSFVASVALFILFLTFGQAYAYLDPNSGSMMLQVILGGLAGVAVAGKLFFHRIKSFFQSKKDGADPE